VPLKGPDDRPGNVPNRPSKEATPLALRSSDDSQHQPAR
jgi:hypothetical protein